MEIRSLRDDETKLVANMLALVPNNERLLMQLVSCRVQEMNDGGMGSLKFLVHEMGELKRHIGKCVCEAEFLDADGMQVSVALNLDQNGDLFELDVWKKDFSPLIRYPASSEIKLLPPGG